MTILVLTISDRSHKGEREDLTGPRLTEYIKYQENNEVYYDISPDEKAVIKEKILYYIKERKVQIVLTCGGTGFAKRDVTPEATKELVEKEAPGIAEYMRLENFKNNKNSFLSRGICGILNDSIIINLPGSPNGALESYKIIENLLLHCVALLKGDIKNCV
ncbi:MAG: MogA/MoaB family molybdenum cofactor biosynthesis protein [Spirochaetes bacterium]|nr:MogA/MoaB family molybdenum cofactor biosynthesis protein [Spirochaetota bacterium]